MVLLVALRSLLCSVSVRRDEVQKGGSERRTGCKIVREIVCDKYFVFPVPLFGLRGHTQGHGLQGGQGTGQYE